MKLIIREFLASLRERDELDAILPDLLSGLGFHVYSRPQRGTTQYGVDIAAIGKDETGRQCVFLFSVKQGNLTRQEWDGGRDQDLRPSLNQIRDAYIPARIPPRYRELPIVICLCFGGDIQEQVRPLVTGYITENTTAKISYDEWNGDRLANLLLSGILREEVLPKAFRSSFQKAVAMLDEPDVAYRHFRRLIRQISDAAGDNIGKRVTVARQIYISLWIMYVWARDADNVEAPFRCSELALLYIWDILRPAINKKNKNAKDLTTVLNQTIQLHLIISNSFIDEKIAPYCGKRHALSTAVDSRSPVDVNLKLFDILGRLAMSGLWVVWIMKRGGSEPNEVLMKGIESRVVACMQLITNNPTLFMPFCDHSSIEIAIVLQLVIASGKGQDDAATWLRQMSDRISFAIKTHGRYPCIFTEYRDLVEHPRERTEAYRKEATAGSTLLPITASWLTALGETEALSLLSDLAKNELSHCTFQLWMPDAGSEDALYRGGTDHGVAICNIFGSGDGEQMLTEIADACRKENAFDRLSVMETGFWPILLVACRHYRMPVPPQFWIASLMPAESGNSEQGSHSAEEVEATST